MMMRPRLNSTINLIFVQNLSRMLVQKSRMLIKSRKLVQILFASIILVLLLCFLQIKADEDPTEYYYEYEDNEFPSPDYINVEKMSFIRNSPKCSASSLKSKDFVNVKGFNSVDERLLLILVHSSRSNLIKRVVLRNYLGSIKHQRWSFHLVFILGTTNGVVEEFVLEEDNDIVIGDFEDNYRNMSYKHMMGYKWAVQYCPEANYILKMDDDVVVDYFKLIDLLERDDVSQNVNSSIMCYGYQDTRVSRTIKGKNSVTFEEYPEPNFPHFCVGMAYLINIQAVQRIYQDHSYERFFWIDDVWVTGILRKDIQMRNISELYYFFYKPTKYAKKVFDLSSWYKNPKLINELPWIFIHVDDDPTRIGKKDAVDSAEVRMIYLWNKIKIVQYARSVLATEINKTASLTL